MAAGPRIRLTRPSLRQPRHLGGHRVYEPGRRTQGRVTLRRLYGCKVDPGRTARPAKPGRAAPPRRERVYDGAGAMSDDEPPWQRRSRRVAYENSWVTVWHDEVTRPDGQPGIY